MRYLIFGAGNVGEQFLIEYCDKLEIEAVFDNNKIGNFHGRKIRKPRFESNVFIIVTTNRYYEIRKQLIELGYSEFHQFIPYQIFNKKMAIAYGNCHTEVITKYLEQNREFARAYGFYPFPLIQRMKEFSEYKDVLPYCKLFMHQSVRKQNKFGEEYASKSLINYLSPQCKIIAIPNLYNMPTCFFPQQIIDDKRDGYIFQFTSGRDENIKKWLDEGKTENDIKQYMVNGGVYDKEKILDMWELFLNKLYIRENEWDIKISDYILRNYKRKKLFYERIHIADVLVKEIATRILKHMGVDDLFFSELPYKMDANEMFIYQDVMEALDLQFEQKYIRLNQRCNVFNKHNMDIDEYIHQLCKWERRP